MEKKIKEVLVLVDTLYGKARPVLCLDFKRNIPLEEELDKFLELTTNHCFWMKFSSKGLCIFNPGIISDEWAFCEQQKMLYDIPQKSEFDRIGKLLGKGNMIFSYGNDFDYVYDSFFEIAKDFLKNERMRKIRHILRPKKKKASAVLEQGEELLSQ